MEHYPTFNYASINGSSAASSSSYGNSTGMSHSHAHPHGTSPNTYDPYSSAYAVARHHHPSDFYARYSQHHSTSNNSLVDQTSRVNHRIESLRDENKIEFQILNGAMSTSNLSGDEMVIEDSFYQRSSAGRGDDRRSDPSRDSSSFSSLSSGILSPTDSFCSGKTNVRSPPGDICKGDIRSFSSRSISSSQFDIEIQSHGQ